MQSAIDSVDKWSHAYGLQLSSKKTKAMITSYRHANNPIALKLGNQDIEYVSNFKFLGVIFDKRLTWQPHINKLKERCQKDLNLLRIISSDKNSCDYKTLRTFYSSLIQSKLDYASFLMINAANTHLLKLDRIQYAGARIMLGVLRNTPTFKLEIEANLIPLKIRRKKLLTEYGTRISMLNGHPVRNYMLKYIPIYKLMSENYKFSALDNLCNEFDKLGINSKNLPIIPIKYKYNFNYNIINAKTSLVDCKKENRSDDQWKILHRAMINDKYPNHVKIYTDGSRKNNKTGCGVRSEMSQVTCRLPDYSSIFTAEMHSIKIAIEQAKSKNANYLILTDSLSVLQAMKGQDPTKHHILADIFQILENNKGNIVLEWIPSHVGIKGNEKADQLANLGTALPIIKEIPHSKKEMKKLIYEKCQNEWKNEWEKLSPALIKFKEKPEQTAYIEQIRKIQVVMTRLRMGVTYWTHGHIFNKTLPNNCKKCNETASLKHIFIDCKELNKSRQKLQKHCEDKNIVYEMGNIFSPPVEPAQIIKFLEDAEIPTKDI